MGRRPPVARPPQQLLIALAALQRLLVDDQGGVVSADVRQGAAVVDQGLQIDVVGVARTGGKLDHLLPLGLQREQLAEAHGERLVGSCLADLLQQSDRLIERPCSW